MCHPINNVEALKDNQNTDPNQAKSPTGLIVSSCTTGLQMAVRTKVHLIIVSQENCQQTKGEINCTTNLQPKTQLC